MLVSVHPVFLLRFAHPHPGLDIDIIIYPINIRVSMMNDIVLHVPHKAVTSQYIQGKRSKVVYPFAIAETSMSAVVHHVEANGRNDTTHQHTF